MTQSEKNNFPTAERGWIQRHQKQLIAVIAWAIVILVIRQVMQDQQITVEEIALQLRSVLQDHWYGPILYLAAYSVRPLLLFPSSLLTLLAGNVFGIIPGFLVALLGGTISGIPAYMMGRWVSVDPFSIGNSTTGIQRFNGLIHQHPFQAVLWMRLLYLPYDPVNLFAGYLHIPFPTYLMATALGNLPTTLAYISFGASVQGNPFSGQVSLNPYAIGLSVGLLIMSLGISWIFNKRHKTKHPLKTQE